MWYVDQEPDVSEHYVSLSGSAPTAEIKDSSAPLKYDDLQNVDRIRERYTNIHLKFQYNINSHYDATICHGP